MAPGRPSASAGSSHAQDASLIENALNKQRGSQQAAPFVATPVEPIFSASRPGCGCAGRQQPGAIDQSGAPASHGRGVAGCREKPDRRRVSHHQAPAHCQCLWPGHHTGQEWQPHHGDQFVAGRRQELLRHQSRDFDGDGNGPHRAADRCGRRQAARARIPRHSCRQGLAGCAAGQGSQAVRRVDPDRYRQADACCLRAAPTSVRPNCWPARP